MSSRAENERKSRHSRFPAQRAHQSWVPKGATTSAGLVNSLADFDSSSVPSPKQYSDHPNQSLPDSAHVGNHHTAVKHYGPRSDHGHGETTGTRVVEHRDPNLPQLVQEIQEKLVRGTVECMICCDMVRRSAPIWSCSSCYSIFHLNCIKKWARAPTSVDLSADKNQGVNWRCPGCQAVQLASSGQIRYLCFCGKQRDPSSNLFLTPHSCGDLCGKPLEKDAHGTSGGWEDLCPHVCVLQCHPGPCPPCKAFAPPRQCPCGKKYIATRCADRRSVLTCGQCCEKLLDCQRHTCEKVCHVGPCDPCQVMVNAVCFCKKMVEMVLCGDMAVKGEVKPEDGVFSCNSTCGNVLACGNHSCQEVCHPGACGDCSLMPGRIKSCYCGKTGLKEERKSCLDPIPSCSQVCDKLLSCGVHRCKELCHAGDCPSCLALVTQKCRCDSTSRTIECYKTFLENEKFFCEKPCGKKKNCGRHRCSERCCPLSNLKGAFTSDWDPHFCQIACGKKLQCGQHTCESLCHSGHCPPCLATIFTELSCACGKTSIPPPVPCGTAPPSCQLPCSVPQSCGHSASHSCHFGDCPPCSVPVAKECVGGHVLLKNIPCGSKHIRCNKLCGKTRQCGLHACGRTCHPPPCDVFTEVNTGSRSSCGQTCGAPRRECRHTCTSLCHPTGPCPDVRCEFPVTISCSCGRLTTSVPCDSGGSNGGFQTDSVFEASVVQKLPAPLVDTGGKWIPLGQRKLLCDDECAKLERKRVLADAFDITPPSLEALHFGENPALTDLLSDLYRRDPKWVLAVEERCKYLVLGKGRGTTGAMKVHVFCPMLKEKRDAVRVIAERWKLAVGSAGWEPKCFIVIHVTPKSKAPPRVLGVKGTGSLAVTHLPAFDPLVDMDPRLVVSFLDLPREADISSLVLRFGGECELVWLNDKNALAIFNDPARAATAMRRLDHGSVYHGAAAVTQPTAAAVSQATNAWGGAGIARNLAVGALKENPWKLAVVQEPTQREGALAGEEWLDDLVDVQASAWNGKQDAILASVNRWSILDSGMGTNTLAAASVKIEGRVNEVESSFSRLELNEKSSKSSGQQGGVFFQGETSDVAEDWETAYDSANMQLE